MRPRTDRRKLALRPGLTALEPRVVPSVAVEARGLGGLPGGYSLQTFNPAGRPPEGGWPVVIAMEGNGFHQANSGKYAAEVAALLRPEGIAVVSLSYPQQRWPGTFDNGILRAIGRVVNSRQYNRDRLGLIGESAGATFALMAGLRDTFGADGVAWTIRAVGDYYGTADFNVQYQRLIAEGDPAFAASVIGGSVIPYLGPLNPAFYASASPANYVSASAPPVFIAEGSAERLNPGQGALLASKLGAVHVYEELHILPNCTHGFGPNGQLGHQMGYSSAPGATGSAWSCGSSLGGSCRACNISIHGNL